MNEKTLLKEKLALGELPPDLLLPWEATEQDHIRGEIEKSNQAILEAYPPQFMAAKIRSAAEKKQTEAPHSGKGSAGSAVQKTLFRWAPLAAAAALLLFFVPWSQMQDLTGSGSSERLKGGEPRFSVYRQTNDQPELLTDQAVVRRGDRLQLSFTVFAPVQGALVSLDGRGMITVHHPTRGQKSEKLDTGEVFLPYSYILDDAPDFEKFFFITSPRPFDIPSITGKITQGRLDPPEADMKVSVITLRKGN